MANLKTELGGILTKVAGFSLEQDVPIIVNSANNGLLLGGSGAGKIKFSTKYLTRGSPEEKEFYKLCDSTGNIGISCKRWQEYETSKNCNFKPSLVQLECLRIIAMNGGRPVELGSAHLTNSGNIHPEFGPEYIIHAAGMGYEWNKDGKGKRIMATIDSLNNAYDNSFRIAQEQGIRTIALPLICTREGYSEVSLPRTYKIFLDQLIKRKDSFDKVILCLDNENSKTLLGGKK